VNQNGATIRDCSRRDETVLDPFGGSGSVLIAAEKTGRQARLIEFDPAYCDRIVRRFEQATARDFDVKVKINQSPELDCQQLMIPAGVQSQLVVGDDIGPTLRGIEMR
jgi:DNA modification methylase